MDRYKCAACGADITDEDLALNPTTDAFNTQNQTPWGSVDGELTISVKIDPQNKLCAACAIAALRSGFEFMAVALPTHVWDDNNSLPERDDPAYWGGCDEEEDEEDGCPF